LLARWVKTQKIPGERAEEFTPLGSKISHDYSLDKISSPDIECLTDELNICQFNFKSQE
jgi:hypothetical protein